MKKVIIILFIGLCSCNQPFRLDYKSYEDSLKIKENELLKREIALKEKELEVTKKELEESKSKSIPISEIYKQVKQGVFLIYTQGQEGISQGTGFFIDRTGTCISNYHVFNDAEKAIIVLENKQQYLVSEIVSYDKELDYIIFKVNNPTENFYPLNISNELPEIGVECFTVGNPKGLVQTLSIGNISGYRNEGDIIQITAEITHGSSGGPLFNREGSVIGITSSGLDQANLNFAINITKVPISNSQSIDEELPEENEMMPTENIKNTISKYYYTISKNDFSTLYDFYTPYIDRYFDVFGISSAEAIEKAKNYLTQANISSAENHINWETLSIYLLSDKTFYVTFNMDYVIHRPNSKNDRSFNLDIIMNMTKDMKIRGIYENILSKK